MTTSNLDQISKRLWDTINVFRGVLDMEVVKDYILALFLFKFLSDLADEMHEFAPFIIPEDVRFKQIYMDAHHDSIGERLDDALRIIKSSNSDSLPIDISFTSYKLGDKLERDKRLFIFLKLLSEFDFSKDMILAKDIFEYIIQRFATEGGKKGGLYYTPVEVSNLLAQLTEPKIGESIYDPACGTGGLLIECAEYIKKDYKESASYALFGQELSGAAWTIARQNMLVHEEYNADVRLGDTILEPRHVTNDGSLRKFDVVVCHPPFLLKDWGYEFASHDPYHRFDRGIPPKSQGDYAFICHMIESLELNSGRLAVVVPHGALFRASSDKKIRQKLIEEGLLDAVIGLPPKLFFGTSIPAVVLIFKRRKKENNVVFIDASKEYEDGRLQNRLTPDGLDKILQCYKERNEVEKFSRIVSLEEIFENEFNLNIPRYIDTSEDQEEFDLELLQEERDKLQRQLLQLEEKMMAYLKM
ncbi:SAM-dependent DNA methyltransferase [Vibrio parahaemolyticus]|nr:SAM-dependent DNA methyltransferase [Vibrio parahaemolyticus]